MAVRDYSKGKIYKIVADTDEEYKPYVGSTIQGLAERMGGHRGQYKSWKKGKGALIMSYDLFDKFGVEKCKIILLEEYPCENKMKLLMKEREWFDKMECCNKVKPFSTIEEKKENWKEYCIQHKEKHANQMKEYYQANKEKHANQMKEYYQANKEKIKGKEKEPFTCGCGSIIQRHEKPRHEKSLKHQNWLKSYNIISL